MMNLPRSEYPRPQMRRDAWTNLNGPWDFAFDLSRSGMDRKFYENGEYTHRITVPFCPESTLSGIGFTDFMAAVWYRRTFRLEDAQRAGRVLLHFGAVDYLARVWVNGTLAGEHRGGYASFTLDITEYVTTGENTLVVGAEDDGRSGKQPRGKQSGQYHSHGCDYTRTTGIWQTVWLEYVPETHIERIKITPDPANAQVLVECDVANATGAALSLAASFDGQPMGEAQINTTERYACCALPLRETHLWDIGSPNLYDLTLTLQKGETTDVVQSYFGLRTVEWKHHAMYLNGRPVFQRLILDQGFYPDGIYTAPSDEALVRDIRLAMDLSFNGARLHEKVFEERFLYHADRLGYLVWGEHANWGLDITTPEGLANFMPEWLEIVRRDYSHPAIVGWCPFNETWDWNGTRQDDRVLGTVYQATKALDPTRPVIDTSGNFHVVTDIYDVHDYEQDIPTFAGRYAGLEPGTAYETHPNRQTYGGQPYFVSEYGGAWWDPTADNTADGWGYGQRPTSEEEVCARYEGLTGALLQSRSVCAFCYTQLTDVEQEKNGLYTYARGRKFSEAIYERIRRANLQKAAIER